MVRALLISVGLVGAVWVGVESKDAQSIAEALKAIGIGLAFIVFLVALGLTDVINQVCGIRDVVGDVEKSTDKIHKSLGALRRAVLPDEEASEEETVEGAGR
jgi:hypothetical protein